MIIKSAYIYGFGCLADKAFTFQPGLNCLTGESDAKKDALISFITASLFGFSENAAENSAQQADDNAHPLLPSRRSMKPFGDVPFGGELKFSERDADYILSAKWGELRGIEVVNVALGSVTLPEEDQELIKKAQRAAMLKDPNYAAATVAAAQADAMVAAANNEAGAMTGFMGYGMAANAGSNAANLFAIGQQQQAAAPAAPAEPAPAGWTCTCGHVNTGNFCPNCGAKKE